MREILFRAKLADNGEWINGYLVELGKESFSDPQRYGICNKAIPLGGSGVCYNLKIDEVISETVGQYTGLTDKNGKKIFEGDIVTMPAYQGGKKKAIIYFKNGKFAVDGSNYSFKDICPKRMEVIGNIYDNKEILDVK